MSEDYLRILVVDDEVDICSLFEMVLSKNGHLVSTARNGREAIEMAKKGRFDVVVSDIRMPDMSGIDVLREVKKLDTETGVVLVTGCASLKTAVDAIHLGADKYLVKPFSDLENEVVKPIEEVASRHRLARENLRLTDELRDANQHLKKMNVKMRKVMARVTMLQQLGRLLSSIDSAEAMFEMMDDTLFQCFDVESYVLAIRKPSGDYEAQKYSGVTDDFLCDFVPAVSQEPIAETLDSGLAKILEIKNTKPFLLVPFKTGGETVGCLCVFGLRDGEEFEDDVIELLSLLASQMVTPLSLVLGGT